MYDLIYYVELGKEELPANISPLDIKEKITSALDDLVRCHLLIYTPQASIGYTIKDLTYVTFMFEDEFGAIFSQAVCL